MNIFKVLLVVSPGFLVMSIGNAGIFDVIKDQFPVALEPKQQQKVVKQPRSSHYQRGISSRLNDRTSVSDAQYMLKQLGFDIGMVDGVPGKKTANSIRTFQRSRGMRADGQITQALLDELSAATYQMNSRQQSGMPVARQQHQPERVQGSRELSAAQTRDKQRAVATGAAAGGVLGVIMSKKMKMSRSEGALAGAVVGGAIGYGVGSKTAEKRGDYARRYDEIDVAIQETDQRINELKTNIARLEKSARNREYEIQEAKTRALRGKNVATQARRMLADLNNEIVLKNKVLKDTKIAINIVKEDLAEVDAYLKNEPNNPALKQQRDKLVKSRDSLIVSLYTLNDIGPKLQKQQNDLTNLKLG